MKQLLNRFHLGIICMAGLLLMALFTACAGVSTTNDTVSITGKIQSVDVANGTVTLSVQGQSQPIVIKGLSSAQASALQSQAGKTYSITATQNSDGSYQINVGSNPVPSTPGAPEGIATPNGNETSGAPVQGSISFIGKVQSVSSDNSSIVVIMPDGSTLSMKIVNSQTDLSDFNGSLPSKDQLIKVDANANSDGNFTATKLKTTDSGDTSNQTKLNTVNFQGVTTSSVGSDGVIHFKVGNKSYSFTIGSNADLSDFNKNAQSIQANQAVKVEVQFNGATGTVVKVSNANANN
jgi:hypothetical protein